MIRFDHYDQVPPSIWPWHNFSPEEMRDRRTMEVRVEELLMNRLQAFRESLDFALPVTSAGRGWGGITHQLGKAVDLGISGWQAHQVVTTAPKFGFTGIGLRQHGPVKDRCVHLDVLTNEEAATRGSMRPIIWTYA